MGLGKTLQVLTCILFFRNLLAAAEKRVGRRFPFRVLVVCPTSVLANWCAEAARFTPTLRVHCHHGSTRIAHAVGNGQSTTDPQGAGDEPEVVVTSLGTARTDVAALSSINWFLFVLDEAQNVKNPSSQQTKAIKSIPARHHIAMSGTPVENRLLEYWSIFDFANKGYLGATPGEFNRNYARPIEKESSQEVLKQFHRVTKPFLLRRLKTDKAIIRDLPDKIYCNESCALTTEQVALYEALAEL
ncbi:unnamed protein product [Amoebophrya sp. A25]|nr:unnamed protein product [Amoebophrya sp. A25]|eukprot:GSA25T00015638001.1